MLSILGVFEYLSHVRRLLSRFHDFYNSSSSSSTTTAAEPDEKVLSNVTSTANNNEQRQRNLLLGPVLNNIVSDPRLDYFDKNFQEDLHKDDYFARELDACLLEIREIERDLLSLKQRECYFYEKYVDFIEKKDELINEFIEYHDKYIGSDLQQTSATKQLRRQSTIYEFNIPVSNRFEMLKRQQTQDFE